MEHAAATAELQVKLGERSRQLQEVLAKASAAEEEGRKLLEAQEAAEAARKEAQELATQVGQAGQ